MPVDERLQEFIELLKSATQQKRLNWERTPDPSEFRARLPSGDYVRIVREDTPPTIGGRYPYLALWILDRTGQVIEQWQPLDPVEWNVLEEVHRMIRRVAFGVDDKLKLLIEDLPMIVGAHDASPL
jgi:hypothetical protein